MRVLLQAQHRSRDEVVLHTQNKATIKQHFRSSPVAWSVGPPMVEAAAAAAESGSKTKQERKDAQCQVTRVLPFFWVSHTPTLKPACHLLQFSHDAVKLISQCVGGPSK